MKRVALVCLLCLICFGASALLFACGGSTAPTNLYFVQDQVDLVLNGSITMSTLLRIVPGDASGFRIDYTSSDEKIARVDSSAVGYLRIVARGYGSAEITATIRDTNLTDSIIVNVTDGDIVDMYVDELSVIRNYYVGQTFERTGMTVWALYESGESSQISEEDYQVNVLREGEKLSVDTPLIKGDSLTISYRNYDYEVELLILDDYIASLEVTTPPVVEQYYIGDSFDSTGMVVEAVYASGKREVITDYTFDSQPFDYNDSGITLTYQDVSLFYPLEINANTVVSNYGLLQEAIDSASDGDSIMITGRHNNVPTIHIPSSKNLIIFGRATDSLGVSVTARANSPAFVIVGEGEGSLTLANFTLSGQGETSALITYQEDSFESLNNFDLTIDNVTINGTIGAIDFALPAQEGNLIENFNIQVLNSQINISEYLEGAIKLSYVQNSSLTITNSQITSNITLEITNCNNLSLNIDGSVLSGDEVVVMDSISSSNVEVKNRSYLNGKSLLALTNLTQNNFVFSNSYLTANIESEGVSVISLDACQENNINISGEVNVTSVEGESYLVKIRDGENNSANNIVDLSGATLALTSVLEQLIEEQTPTSKVVLPSTSEN